MCAPYTYKFYAPFELHNLLICGLHFIKNYVIIKCIIGISPRFLLMKSFFTEFDDENRESME